MDFLITFFIFMVILLIYVHMNEQFKINDISDIYEIDYSNNKQLQTICDLKQPFIFECGLLDMSNIQLRQSLSIYDGNICLKKVEDDTNEPVIISGKNACSLILSDISGQYLIDNNPEYLETLDSFDEIRSLDMYLRPYFTVYSEYDFLLGSQKAHSYLQYHKDYRRFFYVVRGSIKVKMVSWKQEKNSVEDFENLCFYSKTNVWHDKEESLKEVTVNAGSILYVPSYCWYSIMFGENTEIIQYRYKTCMNMIANIDTYAKHYIQLNRLQQKMLRTIE